MKKSIWLFALFFLIPLLTAGKVFVMPFKMDQQNQTSYRWLGKAVSFYLEWALPQKGIETFSEEQTQQILKQNRIPFPFDVTKATVLKLAQMNRADWVVWGKILSTEKSRETLLVQIVLIDVTQGSQKHLPLIKGYFKDLYEIQFEILKQVYQALKAVPIAPGPEVRLPLPDYEKFIKSLLLIDRDKKMELLLLLSEPNNDSDFVNFELGKIYFEKENWDQSQVYLRKIGDRSVLKNSRSFLLALIDQKTGQLDSAQNGFIQLQKEDAFPVETHNNLGVICLAKNDLTTAERCFQYALYLKKDPDVYRNHITLLHAMGRDDLAQKELVDALLLFQEDKGLIQLLSNFLAMNQNGEQLWNVFNTLVPDLNPKPVAWERFPVLKEPFHPSPVVSNGAEYKNFYLEARGLLSENELEEAVERAEDAIDINPFVWENHNLLAAICLARKEFVQAERYALSALFLKECPENFVMLAKIHQATNQRLKLKEILTRGLAKFPDSQELQNLNK